MKRLVFSLTILLFSCSDKQEKESTAALPENKKNQVIQKKTEPENIALDLWLSHYKKTNPDFEVEKFTFSGKSEISYYPSNVKVLNEKGFNEIYKPFLVFNKSKTPNMDLDSYQWTTGADGNASFEADQEVALVDYQKKTAQRIAFFGPSYNIEEAYWKGDSVAVLLGNSYEKVPFIMKYNFKKKSIENLQYPDTLKFAIPYSKVRLNKFGIKTE
ncbi:MAG: hypothetical protein ACXWVZ_03985 [Kaistella sp.]